MQEKSKLEVTGDLSFWFSPIWCLSTPTKVDIQRKEEGLGPFVYCETLVKQTKSDGVERREEETRNGALLVELLGLLILLVPKERRHLGSSCSILSSARPQVGLEDG